MTFIQDSEGHKHYRMKAETAHFGHKVNDINAQKGEKDPTGERLQFNFIQMKHFPKQFRRIKISVPGFRNFGLKRFKITDVKTNEVLFKGSGFTIFGMTRCAVPKKIIEKMPVGEKYKITIQQA